MDSETTRSDFSNTFQSLIVLSSAAEKAEAGVTIGRERARTVGGQEEMSIVLPFAPFDLVDLFLDF